MRSIKAKKELIVAFILMLSLVLALGGSAIAQNKIVYWHNEGGNVVLFPQMKEQIADFEAKNPDIKVEMVHIGWEIFRTKLRLAVDAGAGPDMAEVGYDTPVVYVGLGKAFCVDDYFVKTGLKWTDFAGQLVDSATIGGKHWAMPWRGDTRAMWLRTDLVQQAGLSLPEDDTWTWEDFKAFAKKLSNPVKGIYGYGFPAALNDQDTFCWFQPILKAYGGDFYDAAYTKSLLNNEGAVKAFEFYASLVNEGIAPKDVVNWQRSDMENMFYAGRLAIMQDHFGAGTAMRTKNAALGTKITAIKVPRGPVKKATFGAGVLHLGFDKGKAQNDITWKLMEYMSCNFDVQKQYYNEKDPATGLLTVHREPALRKAAVMEGDWPYPGDNIWYEKVFMTESKYGEAPPKIVPREGFGVNEPIAMALQKMLIENWSAKQAADFAAAGYNKQLAEAIWYPGKK